MTRAVYNLAISAGVLLIGAGVGMWSVPAALVTVGVLVIGLTLAGAALAKAS
jgi:hypothetical protein